MTLSPLFVCTDQSLQNNELATSLAQKNGWELQRIPHFSDAMKFWQKAAKSGRPIIIADYPLDNHSDVETLESFYASFANNNEQVYYAPRPNVHIDVDYPALVGCLKPTKLVFRQLVFYSFVVPVLREPILKILKMMPDSLRDVSMKSIMALKRMMVSSSGPQVSEDAPAKKSSVIKEDREKHVPQAIRGWAGQWKVWDAPNSVIHRDLVDRVGKFFSHPEHLHVIVLNKCNLKCVMCPYHSPRYKVAHTNDYFDSYRSMTPEVFEKIATYAAERGISLQFGQIEEVLMHKQAIEYIALAKSKGVPHVHLTTNGTLLTPEKADALAESGIDSVMFSIDAATPETYKEIRGHDLIQLEENAKYFISLAKKKGIRTVASFILQDMATEERDAFIQKWRDFGVDSLTFYVLTEHDTVTGDFIREAGEMYDKGKRYPCGSPWLQAVIFPQGEVSLCCKTMTDVGWRGVVEMGNVKTDDLDAIWQSEKYSTVRKELLDNNFEDFEVCRKCNIWSAHTSLVEHGDGWVRTYNETAETYEFNKKAA